MKTYYITTEHTIYKDNFIEGEQEQVNFFKNKQLITAKDARTAIKQYFEGFLYYDIDFSFAEIDNNILHYSVQVNNDNEAPSNKEIELWKEEEIDLFIDNIYLELFEVKECEI
jgi:hypothetical protein